MEKYEFSQEDYLIEHQSKVDTNMPQRILDYCMELMREELTNKNTKMTSMMVLEKCKDKEELKNMIIELWKIANTVRRGWLKNLIKYVFPEILDDEEILMLMKGREKLPMEDLIERIKANEKKKEKALIKKTIRTIIKNMLNENLDEDTIIKFTNAKRKEIEKIRMELEAN